MSIYKSSSLAMIPTAYKDGKLYSVRPADGSGDFTFSRGTTATRVASSGYIEKGYANELLYSNQPNNWSVVSVSLTSGQTGYDGSNNAWLFDSSAGYIRNNLSLSGVYTYSIYAKQGTADGIRLRMDAGTDANVYINLSDGSESFSPSGIDYAATSIGDGWWRISVTQNDSAFSNFRVYAIDSSGGSTTGTIYIQDAMVNEGLVAQPYVESIATAAQAGILEDMPRLDYSGGASCPALLLEPQRTNLIEQSEYFEGSDWSATLTTITSNSTTSPEGLINATKLVPNNGATNADVRTNDRANVILGQKYVFSTFAKKGEFDKIQLDFSDSLFGDTRVVADLTNGTITAGSANVDEGIEDYGNGWYRIYLVGEAIASGTNARIFRLTDNGTGDGTSGVYVYGAQWEASSSYPTSYIPTYGASVTRSKDNMGTTFSSPLTSGGEVSVLFDIDGAYNSDINSTGDNIAFIFSNDDRIIYNQNANGFHRIEINVAGRTEYVYLTTSVDRVDKAKICIVVTASTYALYVNGTLEGSGSFTGTGNWTSSNQLSNSMTDAIAVVPMKQLVYFPTALTSSEAIALTTL